MDEQLTETWNINNRINLYLLDGIKDEALADAPASKGRSVAEAFAHLHNVRLMWLKTSAPELLEGLEKIASSYRGVERVFAIQAGREVRVVVTPEQVDDVRMTAMSDEIARRIESELQYPGQIKVVVIRESRAVDFAR